MVSLELAFTVELPIRGEVAGRRERSEAKDRLGPREAPSRACDVHPVLDEVAAGALDDSGAARETVTR